MLISLPYLIKKYNLNIKGIIHVGAHKAEEYKVYKQCGIDNVIWIEANSDLIPTIKRVVGNQPVINAAISDKQSTEPYYKCSLTGSNSILQPNLNLTWRNDLHVREKVFVNTYTLSAFQTNQNMLNLDIQGAELKALKGANLNLIDYIYTEVHLVETYHGCPHVSEIDEYLKDFERVETEWVKNRWGDALYIRK